LDAKDETRNVIDLDRFLGIDKRGQTAYSHLRTRVAEKFKNSQRQGRGDEPLGEVQANARGLSPIFASRNQSPQVLRTPGRPIGIDYSESEQGRFKTPVRERTTWAQTRKHLKTGSYPRKRITIFDDSRSPERRPNQKGVMDWLRKHLPLAA
jgi:hypothetical protein